MTFRFPDDVEGWLTPAEGRCLAGHAEGRFVLEIGSFRGRSAVCMAQTARLVVCVDPFDARTQNRTEWTLPDFWANVCRYGVADRVVPVVAVNVRAVPLFGRVFDLVFIDAGHDLANVLVDIELSLAVLRPGGVLALHDYGADMWPDVKTAVGGRLEMDGARVIEVVDQLAVVRP